MGLPKHAYSQRFLTTFFWQKCNLQTKIYVENSTWYWITITLHSPYNIFNRICTECTEYCVHMYTTRTESLSFNTRTKLIFGHTCLTYDLKTYLKITYHHFMWLYYATALNVIQQHESTAGLVFFTALTGINIYTFTDTTVVRSLLFKSIHSIMKNIFLLIFVVVSDQINVNTKWMNIFIHSIYASAFLYLYI